MKQVMFIPILAVVLVTSSAVFSPIFAEPIKGCRDDPNIRVVVRSGRPYTCHNRVCCLTQACLTRRAPPAIEEICVLKGLPSNFTVSPPATIPQDLPLQDRKGGTVPTPCPDSSTAC